MTKYPLVDKMTLGVVEPTPDQSAMATEHIHRLVDAYNDTPDEAKATVLVSFFVSLCMNAPNPGAVFAEISENVIAGIDQFTTKRGHH